MGKRLIPTSATAVVSNNRKLGDAAATYASQVTCPDVCPLRGNGCYAEYGLVGMQTHQLNAGAAGLSAKQVAGVEASKIDALPPGNRPLRLHVVGDCSTDATAQIVSGAADRYTKRTGRAAWTYTHGWRDVDRSSWGNVSVLASCETTAEVEQARARGYAPAIVVDSHPSAKTYQLDMVKVIPCPAEFNPARNCADCGLCQRADWLRDTGRAIGFAIHSGGVKKARAALAAKN